MTETDKLAWEKKGIKPTAPPDKVIAYCVARAMYADYEAEMLDQRDAQAIKLNALDYLTFLQSMARSNSKIIRELSILTSPRKELTHKTKAELLDIIARIEALVTGIIQEHGDKVPEFMTIKAVDG